MYFISCRVSPPPPRSTLFPYTTLFRSDPGAAARRGAQCDAADPGRAAQRDAASGRDRNGGRLREPRWARSEEHTSELQSQSNLVCRLLLEKKKNHNITKHRNCIIRSEN